MNFKEVFEMSNEDYDKMKYIVEIILPALATFIAAVGFGLNWEATKVIVLVLTATNALLGTVLGISNLNYKEEQKYL